MYTQTHELTLFQQTTVMILTIQVKRPLYPYKKNKCVWHVLNQGYFHHKMTM